MYKTKCFFVLTFLFIHFSLSYSDPNQTKDKNTSLQHEASVVLKLIQVYVADKEGNPITDLSKDDFKIYDNGELKQITDFETHFLLDYPSDIKKIPESDSVPPLMPRKFFIMLDFFQNDLAGIKKTKQAALRFIQELTGSEDEITVLSYHMEKGMRLHEYLSIDYEKVKKTIQEISAPPAWQMKSSRESCEEEKRWMRNRTFQFISEMKELAKSLRYISGYKNLVLFSGGVRRKHLYDQEEEHGEGEEELKAVGFKKIRRGTYSFFKDMAQELAAANCVVFSVNTYNSRAIMNEAPIERGDHSLQIMSQLSGGKYFPEVEYRENIVRDIHNATGNYYVLGYYISENWDGRYHNLKVEVTRKGARVLAQKGYYDPKPFAEFTDFEKKLHLTSLALNEESYFEPPQPISLLSLHSGYKKENESLLIVEIPRGELGEIIQGETEVVNLILGAGNEVIVSERCEMNFSAFKEEVVFLYFIHTLEPSNYGFKTIVRNLKTGKAAVGSAEGVIPERPKSGLIIDPPLLITSGDKAAYARLSEDLVETENGDPTSLRFYYPFLTKEQIPIVQYLESGQNKIYAIIRGSFVGIEDPEIDLAVNLIGADQQSKIILDSIVLSAQEEDETTDVLFLEIELPGLSIGEYTLEFIAEEKNSGSISESSTKIHIR